MSEESIRSEIAALGPWFHKIDLGRGITTKDNSTGSEPSDHPLGTWEFVKSALPADLAGKTVLDVGCNAGFYSIEAKRRGARRVLGIDAHARAIKQACFVRDTLGLDIDYERMSVYDISPRNVGTFDVTMALGLLYHCKHLVLAVERLFLVCRGLVILESEVLPEGDSSYVRSQNLGGIVNNLHALMYVENSALVPESPHNWFVPSVSALVAILKDVGFQDPKMVHQFGSRAVVTAHNDSEPDSARNPVFLGADLELLAAPTQICRAGQAVTVEVRARNTGFSKWLQSGIADRGRVALGARIKGTGSLGGHPPDSISRAGFSSDIRPGESQSVSITIKMPPEPGAYAVELDLVSEHTCWFQDLGASKPIELRVEVVHSGN